MMSKLKERFLDIDLPIKSLKYFALFALSLLAPFILSLVFLVMVFEPVWKKNKQLELAHKLGQTVTDESTYTTEPKPPT